MVTRPDSDIEGARNSGSNSDAPTTRHARLKVDSTSRDESIRSVSSLIDDELCAWRRKMKDRASSGRLLNRPFTKRSDSARSK